MFPFLIRVQTGQSEQNVHVYEAMLVQELKEHLCAMIECQVDKSFLWKDDLEMTNNQASLRDYGVSANDLLKLKRKRSHGGKNSFSRVQHRAIYQLSDNRPQRLALLSWFQQLSTLC